MYTFGTTKYTQEELEYFVYDSICPAHCSKCGAYIGDFEPDAEELECEECGSKGASILILLGLM